MRRPEVLLAAVVAAAPAVRLATLDSQSFSDLEPTYTVVLQRIQAD